jgi:hypothetical protein
MPPLPEPPDGSAIERIEDADGVWLAWRLPSFGPGRYFWAAVFGFFTCVWAGMMVAAALGGGPVLATAGFIVLLAVVGSWVPFGLWLTLSRPRPESVLMTAYEFRHDPGWSPPLYFLGQTVGGQPMFPRGPVTVPKSEVAFARDGGRLSFEHAGERVLIGALLDGPDREWLFAVLEDWRRGRI